MENDSDDSFCITDSEGWYIPGYRANKKLNCSQLVTLTDYSIWILDLESRGMEKIDLGEEKSRFIVGPWSPNGNGFYILSDLNREFMGVAFYHIDKSQLEWITTPQHDVELIDICLDGKLLAWTENVDGYSKLYVKDLEDQKVREVALTLVADTAANSLEGVIEKLKLSPDGTRIGIMMDCPTSPTNVYVVDIGKSGEYPCTRVTTSLLGNLSENMLIKPQLMKYKSFDSLEISAIFTSLSPLRMPLQACKRYLKKTALNLAPSCQSMVVQLLRRDLIMIILDFINISPKRVGSRRTKL